MIKVEGHPKSLKQLLLNTKYSIHYYQREYMWQRKQMEELLDDLTSEFLEFYKPGDDRKATQNYGVYFMGSVVLAGRENAIIDGQQRFSSLTLLLMYLNNKLRSMGISHESIGNMIFSEAYGEKSFNLNIEDRAKCMDAIFNAQAFDTCNASESVANLYGRYVDIIELFPSEDITNDMLLIFCDWLIEKVYFIEIVAAAEQDAHKIFVTMNDRGLSLTSTEMLKGYLLSEISDDKKREELNNVWKDKILSLKQSGDKEDETFIKAWLRAQYAETIRETKAGAINQDFDIIGGSFHKWVRDEREKLNLRKSVDFELFIEHFSKFADIYKTIKGSENSYKDETKYIYFNSRIDFTLQPQLLLAPICFEDSNSIILEKMNLVARFIDLLIMSRVTNYKSVDYSTIKNYIFKITKIIRRRSVDDLKKLLKEQYDNLHYNPEVVIHDLRLNSFTKKYIKNMLARITSYIEVQIGCASNYCNYMNTQTKNPFEIEHIITDHFEWFVTEYADQDDFKRWRNSIGGLLLLHKSINASLNDKRYNEKLSKYCSNEGNIYTESLGVIAYQNNPNFLKFITNHNLNFKPYNKFEKDEIHDRIKLIIQLFNLVWNTDMFVTAC